MIGNSLDGVGGGDNYPAAISQSIVINWKKGECDKISSFGFVLLTTARSYRPKRVSKPDFKLNLNIEEKERMK